MSLPAPLLHLLFESLGYTLGFWLFLRARRASPHPVDTHPDGLWIVVGLVLGAALGAKLLDWLSVASWMLRQPPWAWMSGKTIVGGLLGGWVGVELAKRAIGERRSTGDLLVEPLCAGLAVGRVGCLLSGPADHTAGLPSDLPWALTWSDGVPRHPTVAYEILYLSLLLGLFRQLKPRRSGDRFLVFMLLYLGFRFFVDFLKPPFGPDPAALPPLPDLWGPVTPIQAACALGIGYACARLWRRSTGWTAPTD